MARFIPPMYGRVRKKVPPRPTRPVAVPVAPEKAADPEVPKKKKKAVKKVPAATKKVAKKAVKKEPVAAKKTTKKSAVKKLKPLKWDETMTQKELYKKAKAAGLDVKARDWKSEIVAEIKKHNKKASK